LKTSELNPVITTRELPLPNNDSPTANFLPSEQVQTAASDVAERTWAKQTNGRIKPSRTAKKPRRVLA
jgi:hypothetical protein